MNELELFRSKITAREVVNALEKQIKPFENLNGLELKHYFSDGVYARELFIPKDTIIVGKIHNFENLNILSYGEMSVLVGENIKRIAAPFTVVSPPGTKRIAYTHTDCVWVTILRTEELDVDKIEDHFTSQSEEDYLKFLNTHTQYRLAI